MRVEKNTVIYVGCPAFNKTGGTELAHQLVKTLLENGKNAYILYYDTNKIGDNSLINPAFTKYVSEYVTLNQVDDKEENILVVPEIRIELLSNFNKLQKAIWWMSVDNYLKNNGFMNAVKFYGFLRAAKLLLTNKIALFERNLNNQTLHLYQSEYARLFLESKGVTNVARLSDYLNDTYLNTSEVSIKERKDNVLYNPKKGIVFTQKLIKAAPQFNWIPIQNMTTDEVRELLLTSKVYVDFGNHPGKDRFPREAAISGCCIITDKKGSAKNSVDICIPESYKFEDVSSNIELVTLKIKDCLDFFEKNIQSFDSYRESILSEKKVFENDVKTLFG
ncbi:hypothetical protein [Limosilactobacillus ingluviei]|uniref:hypothetical protein n=1 Tax=Limosilactobacillus ingluviei TaxID=148604 RepID=UPI0024B98F35|nr:hypothetical protein [Limosilactobacillus ingluviei]